MPLQPDLTLDERRCLPWAAIEHAQLLAGAVRDRDPEAIERILARLTPHDVDALLVTLAAMLPMDATPTRLLAWNDTEQLPVLRHPPTPRQPCGTHAAFNRHQKLGEQPCRPCVEAERDYQRGHRRRRAERLRLVVEATG